MIKKDWIECTLGEIGQIVSGGTPKTGEPTYWGDDISWISPSDLSNYTEKYINKGKKSISKLGLQKSSAKLFPKNTVLFSSRAPIGYTVIANKEMCTNQGFKSISPFSEINSEYIYYFLKSSKQEAERVATGTTFKEISKTAFSKLLFPLPPSVEQKAIVKKIEALFSSLDSGIADLKKAQDQLVIYRQAVLKKAFDGGFTNLKNIPFVQINSVCELNPKLENRNEIDPNLKVQFLPMKLVEEIKNKIHLSEIRKFSEVQKKSYTYFSNNDVLFAKVTPCMENGKIAIAHGLKNEIGYGSSEFHVLRCNESILNQYLFHFIVQEKFRHDAQHAMTGAVGLRRVPKKYLEDYKIPFPSLKEQHQIVREIESRLSVCDKVEESLTESLIKAQALRQSILKKAFEGKLLSAEEIAKCKADKDYEPASVLLKKIKAEKKQK